MFLGRLTVCARPGSQGTIHRPQNPWGPISRYFRTGASVRTKGTEDDVAQSAFYKPVRVVRVREGKHGPGLILLGKAVSLVHPLAARDTCMRLCVRSRRDGNKMNTNDT
jgi:hypothetical protein